MTLLQPHSFVKSWLALCNPPPLNFAEFGAPAHRHPQTFLYRGGASPREPPHNNRKRPTHGEKCPHYGKIVAKWTQYVVNKIWGDFLRSTLDPAPSEGAHDRMQGLKLMFKHEGITLRA